MEKSRQLFSTFMLFVSEKFVWTCGQYPEFRCLIMAPFSAPRPGKPTPVAPRRQAPIQTCVEHAVPDQGWWVATGSHHQKLSWVSFSWDWGPMRDHESVVVAGYSYSSSRHGRIYIEQLRVVAAATPNSDTVLPFHCRTLRWYHFCGEPASNTCLKRHSCSARCSWSSRLASSTKDTKQTFNAGRWLARNTRVFAPPRHLQNVLLCPCRIAQMSNVKRMPVLIL